MNVEADFLNVEADFLNVEADLLPCRDLDLVDRDFEYRLDLLGLGTLWSTLKMGIIGDICSLGLPAVVDARCGVVRPQGEGVVHPHHTPV